MKKKERKGAQGTVRVFRVVTSNIEYREAYVEARSAAEASRLVMSGDVETEQFGAGAQSIESVTEKGGAR